MWNSIPSHFPKIAFWTGAGASTDVSSLINTYQYCLYQEVASQLVSLVPLIIQHNYSQLVSLVPFNWFIVNWFQLVLPLVLYIYPIGSMYAIYGNIYHQYTPNVSIYTIHGSYGYIYIFYTAISGYDSIAYKVCNREIMTWLILRIAPHSCHSYPLVNVYSLLWKITIFNG